VLAVYRITQGFPQEEKFGLTQQVRRASVSVMANIAEGTKRRSDRDFSHFLNIAEGSLEEVKCYLILCKDLDYINENVFKDLFAKSEEIGKMLQGLMKKLRT
jgi:four helix bundle protein